MPINKPTIANPTKNKIPFNDLLKFDLAALQTIKVDIKQLITTPIINPPAVDKIVTNIF